MLIASGFALACGKERATQVPTPAPSGSVASESPLLDEARRFVSDAGYRRQVLEQSLVNRGNGYARARLARYSPDQWGKLPVGRFRARPVRPSDVGRPPPTPDGSWTVSGGNRGLPGDPRALRELGQRLFTSHPAQIERSMLEVLRDREGPARYGLWQTSTSVGGLVWVELPGGVYPAFTCSSCHSSATARGVLRPGVPNHRLDLGKAKDVHGASRSLYSTWGPGRMDIAADRHDNPVVIGDVRAVRFQTHFHRTANIVASLPALAVRVETGLITAHRQERRPTPLDAFAIAAYLWHLGEQLPAPPISHPGVAPFDQQCARCHGGPGLSGKPVAADSIASPVAKMPSAARGTGNLQVTSLRGVADRELLLFGGYAQGFEDLLDPDRKSGGHPFGRDLDPAQRRALIDYLEHL